MYNLLHSFLRSPFQQLSRLLFLILNKTNNNMSVRITKSTMVYPAEATPKRSLWLSKIDMMIRQPYSHTNVLYIYRPNNTNSSTFFDVEILKEALSKTLVLYYPVAGRLKMNENNNRFEIDCNEKGVLFIEAETSSTLTDVNDDEFFNKELIIKCDYSKGLSSFPLFITQITRFNCGGVTISMAIHHHVTDGFAHIQFVTCWANLARGVEPEVIPCHDRAVFLGPRLPPRVNFKHIEYDPPLPPLPPKSLSGETLTTISEYFRLSEEQIKTLKCESISTISNKISTFKVIAAHVWRSACKARGLSDDQDVKLFIHTDGRSRLSDPSLPQGYFGNVLFFACCVAKAGDLIHNPLSFTISKIDEAVKKLGNYEYLRSAVDYLELQSDLTALIRGDDYATCPNLQIIYWGGLNISGADFGWGKPDSIGHGEIKREGQSKIMISNKNKDNSTYVGIGLFAPHMDLFRKYFYDFPNIIRGLKVDDWNL